MSATERLYWSDPYLLEFDARVLARSEHEGQPAVVLDRTAFYAESGGQPWDTGTLGGVRVKAVVEKQDQILHVLEATLAADAVRGHVDATRRRDHREQHHGQHLLSQAIVELHRSETISFHLGAETCTIDLDRALDDAALRAAETRANEIIWDARPVRVRNATREEAVALGLDPAEHVGPLVRLIEVENFDLRPCGGTHPRSTAEVGVVVVLGQERYKGGSRVSFACGHRALAAVHQRLLVLDQVGGTLAAGLPELPAAARAAVERLAAGDKRNRELTEWALEGEAHRVLAESPDATVVRAYDGWTAQDLRSLAQKLVRLRPCVALLGSRADKAHLVFAQSEGRSHDLGVALKAALLAVDGRGGGRGNVVQGGGERLEKLDEALAIARAAIEAKP